ncbi:MAG TPA: zf-HC2 domain-containing protein [Actinomycetota bacterium]|nr:zf-HC2 domain-containing protein [Actinomycetota bacterium]
MRVVGDPPEDLEVEEQPGMDCVDVRDRLTEYALSLLPAAELEPVERHLAWCAGCRKEAAELAGGAAAAAMAIPQAEPPRGLEDRIVREIRQATGDARDRKGRARSRTIIVLAAALAILMGLTTFFAVARHQSQEQAQTASQGDAQLIARHFSQLLQDLTSGPHGAKPGDLLQEVQLTPELGSVGGGKAEMYLSPHRDDWVLVYVGGLDPKAGPFGATIQADDGSVLVIGRANADNGGGVALFNQFPQSLKKYTRIVVTDRRGHVVLTGTATGVTARPTTVG